MRQRGKPADAPPECGDVCPHCGNGRATRNRFKNKAMIDPRKFSEALALDPSLTDRDVRVAIALLGHLDFENRLPVSQVEIALRLKASPAAVNRNIKKLREAGVLLDDGPGPAGHRLMRFSSAYVWKGSAQGHRHRYPRDLQATQTKREEAARRRREKLKVVEPA
jgi:biotin operon repressor